MTNNEETDVTDFLKRIAGSFFAGIIWLFINMTIGIFGGWLFFEQSPSIGNIIFYIWLIISFGGLLWLLYRTWKKKFPHG